MASYRNTYDNFYTDKQGSYVAIGAIVPVLANKHTTSSTETGYTPPPNIVIEDSHFCQRGFLYCDGEEYDITSYPTLYTKIANTYNDSTESESLTNPINNNSILFKTTNKPGSIKRTFINDGSLYCEIRNNVTVSGNNTYSTRVVPNGAEITFVGGLGDFPAGTDANGDPVFVKDTPVTLEYAGAYQDLAQDSDCSVHKFMIGQATDTVDLNWSISSSTLIQGSDPLPILPEIYYGIVPEYDPASLAGAVTGGNPVGTGAIQYANALNWSPEVNWGGMQGLPSSVTVDSWEVYMHDMVNPNRILWHIKNIPASTTSLYANAELPTGASYVKNFWDRKSVPRAFNQGTAFDTDAVWIRSNGYSGPQPAVNTKTTYRINVICNLSNQQKLVEHLDFTAGIGPTPPINNLGPITWSSYLSSPGTVTGATNAFEEDVTSSRAVGTGGLTWDPKFGTSNNNVQYNFKVEVYDPSGNGNTKSRIWPTSSTQLPWVNHTGSGWTTIHEVAENTNGSMNQGDIYKIEFQNSSDPAGDAGFSAIRIDGVHLIVDGEDEPLQDSPHYHDNLVITGQNSGVTSGTSGSWNIDWTTISAHTNTAGVITGHPLVRIRKPFVQSDYPQILGKFKVPDYRDRKLIGMGEGVSGSGSPLVEGRSSAEVGDIGGKWIIPKDVIDDAAEFFEISDVTTSGYSDTNTLIQAYLTGEKEFKIGPIEDYIFNRPAEHEHQLLHSVTDEMFEENIGGVDRFTTAYSNIKGRILDFEPNTADGAALGHSHGLMDTRPVSSVMSTYGNSSGIGDKVTEYSGGSLEDDFGNSNLPSYSDENSESNPAQEAYYPVQNAFDGVAGNFCSMTVSDQKWSMLTFGTPIANVTKIVLGGDGTGKFGYNTGNLATGSNSNGLRKDIILYNTPSTPITLTNLYFVTTGNPLGGSGDGYCHLYDVKLTLSGGSEIEVKQISTGCSKYKITEPPLINIQSMTSDGTDVTVITVDDHGLQVGDWIQVKGAGTTGEAAKFNGEHQIIQDGWNTNTIKYTPDNGAPAANTTPAADVNMKQAAGYYEDVTTTPDPSVWAVDALPTTIGGKPIYSNDPDQYGDPLWTKELSGASGDSSYTASYSASAGVYAYFFTMVAQGGGGASSEYDGSDGDNASVSFSLPVNGQSVNYTITLSGGKGGTKGTAGGAGGAGGTVTITASDGNPSALLNDERVSFSTNTSGTAGASGGQLDNTQPSGGIGSGVPSDGNAGNGGDGSYSTTPASSNYTYPASGVATSDGSYNALTDNRLPSQSFIDYIEITAVGGAGGHGSKLTNSYCPTYPYPGPGGVPDDAVQEWNVTDSGGQLGLGGDRGRGRKVFGISGNPNNPNPTYNTSGSYQFANNFQWIIGKAGGDGKNDQSGPSTEPGGAGGAGVESGGKGGDGMWGNGSSGGGGGGSTGIKTATGTWIMGAGGGGGAGGAGGGDNGRGHTDACWNGGNGEGPEGTLYTNTAITSSNYDDAQKGGQSGCTAGGGGGGGAGFGPNATGSGGTGGTGGDSHANTGSGTGGHAGRSAGSTTYLESISESEGGEGDGYVKFHIYYTGNSVKESGGGGGSGAKVIFNIVGDDIQSSISITRGKSGGAPGQGGAPVAAESGHHGYVKVTARPIQEGGRQILGYTSPSGRVYEVPGYNTANEDWADVGTGSTGSKADIWHTASDDIKMITPATGTFAALANHSTVPTGHPTSNYFRFAGDDAIRYLRMGPLDLRSAEQLIFKVIKGTGSNGGDAPEEALELLYNTDVESETNSDIQQIATTSEGVNGNWFTSVINLDDSHPARSNGVYLYVRQSRPASIIPDNDEKLSDSWGIAQFGIVYGPVTERVFVPSISAYLPGNTGACGPDGGVDLIRKTVTAKETNIRFTDGTFTLSSATPISVSVTANPQETIPLITRYHRAKYLIKAF